MVLRAFCGTGSMIPMDAVEPFKDSIIRDMQKSGHYSALNVFKLFEQQSAVELPNARLERLRGLPDSSEGLGEFLRMTWISPVIDSAAVCTWLRNPHLRGEFPRHVRP